MNRFKITYPSPTSCLGIVDYFKNNGLSISYVEDDIFKMLSVDIASYANGFLKQVPRESNHPVYALIDSLKKETIKTVFCVIDAPNIGLHITKGHKKIIASSVLSIRKMPILIVSHNIQGMHVTSDDLLFELLCSLDPEIEKIKCEITIAYDLPVIHVLENMKTAGNWYKQIPIL